MLLYILCQYCKNYYRQKKKKINNDTLYVKLWNERDYKDDKNYCELAKVPILDYSFEYLPSLTLPKGHPNLSVLNNHIVIAIPRDDELFLLALLMSEFLTEVYISSYQ